MLLADTVIPIYTSTCIFQPFYSPFTKAQLSRKEERPALARCHCSSTPQESRNPRTRKRCLQRLNCRVHGPARLCVRQIRPTSCSPVSVSVRFTLYTCSPVSVSVRSTLYTRSPVSVCPSDPPHTVQSRLCVSVRSTSHRTVPSLCVRQIHLTPYSPVSVCPLDPASHRTVPSLCVRQIHLTPYSPVDNLARSWPVYTASVDIGINVRGLNYDLVLSTPFMMGVIRA